MDAPRTTRGADPSEAGRTRAIADVLRQAWPEGVKLIDPQPILTPCGACLRACLRPDYWHHLADEHYLPYTLAIGAAKAIYKRIILSMQACG